MSVNSIFSLHAILWLGIHLSLVVLTLWISIIRFRQGATGSRVMMTGAVTHFVAAITLRVIPFIDLSRINPGAASGVDGSFWIITTVSATASCGLILFLVGVLLHALRGGSESARIVELEAIIRDRDVADGPRS